MSDGKGASDDLYAQLDRALSNDELGGFQRDLLVSLVRTVIDLANPATDLLDLKIADAALGEIVAAFEIFRPYRHIPKLTMFGSARTQEHDPIYALAVALAERIAADDWMVITGAGPGIMQAGIEGAGSERSFGVNILLPFEQGANPLIALDPKLVEMRYFFTRKLMMIKESHAYAVLPGGYGTLDEAFELLTLLQTGKAQPAPLVFVETPGGNYWDAWQSFLEREALGNGYVSPEDESLYKIVKTVDEAVDEIHGFYANYHSVRMVGRFMVIRMKRLPPPDALEQLNREFADIVVEGSIEPSEPLGPERSSDDHLELARLKLVFNRMHYGRLRQFIDALNQY
jgi:uncharacterized protein (TIGR00730 family)